MLSLSNEIAKFWRKIACRLPYMRQPDKFAFRLDDPLLDDIARNVSDNEGRFLKMLDRWRWMDVSHTWGPLWDTLFACDLGRAADTVFTGRRANCPERGKPGDAIGAVATVIIGPKIWTLSASEADLLVIF